MKRIIAPLGLSMLLALAGCATPEITPTGVSSAQPSEQSSPTPVLETQVPVPEPTASVETSPSTKVSTSPSETPEPTEKPTPTPTPTPIPTTEPAVPVVEFKKIDEILYTTQGLNVRNGPGSTYKLIDSLNSGDEIPVDAELGNWKRIKGSDLWVHSGYLTSVNPKKAQETSEASLKSEIRTILTAYGCPTAGVILDDSRLGQVANGKADWGANQVLIRSTTPKERLNYVVAHECMHLRQYDVYGGDIGELEKATNKIYGGVSFEGLEQNADCMTQTLGISTFHYTAKCSGSRGKAATTILSGKTL